MKQPNVDSTVRQYEVAPVRHGQWLVEMTDGDAYMHMQCSVCQFYWRETGHRKYFRYCPGCGAKMDKEGEE